MPTKQKLIETLEMIIQDTKDDAKNFEGRPFDGRTVSEYLGYLGAGVAGVANIVKLLIEEERNEDILAVGRKRQEWIDNLPDGVPCDHIGCLSHISHPCEGCGRIGGHRARKTGDR